MKKLLPLLLLTGILSVSCVDKDYDLANVDTDDTTIGGEGSEFRIPLATVEIGMDKIAQQGTNIEAILNEADIWLPSPLPAGTKYVDIRQLGSNPNYIDGLLDQLFIQLGTDDRKLSALADLIWDKYKEEFRKLLNIPSDADPETYKAAFKFFVRQQNTQVVDKTSELARSYLTEQLTLEDISFDIDKIDLDDSVVDMLAKNLDKPGNSLHIYGEITSVLPVGATFLKPQFSPTNIVFPDIVVEANSTSSIAETKLTEEDLRKILEGIRIVIPVQLDKYYPQQGFDSNRKDQFSIRLRMVKRGGLNLNL